MDFSAENFTLIIVALITGLISPLSIQIMQYLFFKRKSVNNKHNLNQNEAIRKDELISSKLRILMEKYACDRVWVAEFHNGGHTYSGKSFQRFSTTYESIEPGVSSEATHTQNIPTSIFSDFFKELESSSHILNLEVGDYNKKKEGSTYQSVQNFFLKRGTTSYICFQIKDISGNFVGFLCLEGVIKKINLTEEDIKKLALASSNLAGYLSE
jgi:hypothetical protein